MLSSSVLKDWEYSKPAIHTTHTHLRTYIYQSIEIFIYLPPCLSLVVTISLHNVSDRPTLSQTHLKKSTNINHSQRTRSISLHNVSNWAYITPPPPPLPRKVHKSQSFPEKKTRSISLHNVSDRPTSTQPPPRHPPIKKKSPKVTHYEKRTNWTRTPVLT